MITRGRRPVVRNSLHAKEPHCSKSIPLRLHKDVKDNAVLIDRSPEIVRDAIDLESGRRRRAI